MFSKFTMSLIVATLLCSLGQAQVNWSTDLETAKAKAASQNQLVLLHFTADWCGPCQQLESFVFNNISVADAMATQVVPVKVDVDLNPGLVDKYGVESLPFDVAIHPNGTVLMTRNSPRTREDYISMLGHIGKLNQSQLGETKDPVQRQLIEHIASRGKAPQEGLDFGSNAINTSPSAIDFRPGAQSNPQAEQVRTTSPEFRPSDFSPSDFRATASASQHTKEFRVKTPQVPEFQQPVQQPVQITNRRIGQTNGFAQNSAFGQQVQQVQQAPQPQYNIPQQQAEIVRPRVNPQRIINPMFAEEQARAATAPTQSTASIQNQPNQLIDPVLQFNNQARQDQVAMPQQEQSQPAAASSGSQFALSGNCPVTLLTDSQWVPGDKQWGCVHRGKTYIFASQEKMGLFLQTPDKYSPILAGFDPVDFYDRERLTPGIESLGVFMSKAGEQKVVLFSSADNRAKFQAEPKKYLEAVRIATQVLDQQRAR